MADQMKDRLSAAARAMRMRANNLSLEAKRIRGNNASGHSDGFSTDSKAAEKEALARRFIDWAETAEAGYYLKTDAVMRESYLYDLDFDPYLEADCYSHELVMFERPRTANTQADNADTYIP